jgi:hypothetical protein
MGYEFLAPTNPDTAANANLRQRLQRSRLGRIRPEGDPPTVANSNRGVRKKEAGKI